MREGWIVNTIQPEKFTMIIVNHLTYITYASMHTSWTSSWRVSNFERSITKLGLSALSNTGKLNLGCVYLIHLITEIRNWGSTQMNFIFYTSWISDLEKKRRIRTFLLHTSHVSQPLCVSLNFKTLPVSLITCNVSRNKNIQI